MPDDPDETLIARARAGDREALAALVQRHQDEVYRFGMKMCRDPEDAADVLQETLLAMARGVGDFRGASSVTTWLYTIARSFCIKKRRRSKFAPVERSLETAAPDEAARLADPARPPDEALAARQVEQALERAIADLEPRYREVLVLRDLEGLTAPQVGEVLGLSVQAVKSRLHRARSAVRAQLAPLLEAPPAPAPATCPDVVTVFSQYLEGELGSDACAAMERHLEACPHCRGTCDSLKRTLALCRTTAPAVAVPPAVQASVRIALRDLLGNSGGSPA